VGEGGERLCRETVGEGGERLSREGSGGRGRAVVQRRQWGKGERGNPAARHGGEYGEKDSPRIEKSLSQCALNIGIAPVRTARKALQSAKTKALPSADRVYFSCKGHSLVWYKPETE
jgi:hypothetical protein